MGETCRRPMTTEIRILYNILTANVKGSHHFKDLSVDGRIILKCILKEHGKWVMASLVFLETQISVTLL
jgi:hypothetical protein